MSQFGDRFSCEQVVLGSRTLDQLIDTYFAGKYPRTKEAQHRKQGQKRSHSLPSLHKVACSPKHNSRQDFLRGL